MDDCAICGRCYAIDSETGYQDPVCPDCVKSGQLDDWNFHRAMAEREDALEANCRQALSSLALLAADRGLSVATIHAVIDQALDAREVERRR